MDPKFQTSFIPKKIYEQPKGGTNLLTVITAIVFAVTLLGYAGVYFYSQNIDTQLAAADQTIQKNRDAFDVPFITTMSRLDDRIEAAKKLLASHTALSPVFTFFQTNMLKTLRFDTFNYTYSPQKISIVAKGQAESYQAIAFQSELFADNRLISDVIFSDFNLDSSGKITFTFGASVDPRLVSYSDLVLSGGGSQTQ